METPDEAPDEAPDRKNQLTLQEDVSILTISFGAKSITINEVRMFLEAIESSLECAAREVLEEQGFDKTLLDLSVRNGGLLDIEITALQFGSLFLTVKVALKKTLKHPITQNVIASIIGAYFSGLLHLSGATVVPEPTPRLPSDRQERVNRHVSESILKLAKSHEGWVLIIKEKDTKTEMFYDSVYGR